MSNDSRKLLARQLANLSRVQESVFHLEDYLDKHLLQNQRPDHPDGMIHPSSIGDCPRKIWFKMNKISPTNWEPHPAKLITTFEIGKAVELWVKREFRMMNILIDVERPIPKNRDRVAGRCDCIIFIPELNEYFLIDVKTANNNSFSRMIPHKHYLWQVGAYLTYHRIEKGIVFYINKDTSEKVSVHVNVNDFHSQEARNLIALYNYNYDNGICPDVSEIRKNCTEKSCSYFSECCKYPESAISLNRKFG